MKRMENKIAVITGGASGIGDATVRRFIDEGAKVVIADINEEKGKELEKSVNKEDDKALFIKVDMTNENQVKELFEKTIEKFGKVDVLFNNAGMATIDLAHEMSFEDWNKTISLNLNAVFLGAKYAIEKMLDNGGGSIINTASIMGHVAAAKQSSYNASKHAVVGLTKSLALEYATKDIRVNAVCPGYVETPLLDFLEQDEKDGIAALHPINRLAKPIEIANAVLFLASDEASFVTGSSLLVDGGYTAQ